ncbi:unnamed protein product [Calypogeia fissa]
MQGAHCSCEGYIPRKIHGMCAHHLRANVKTQFGKAAEGFFNATVYANTLEQFNEILVHLEKSMAKGVAAAYIKKLDPKLYLMIKEAQQEYVPLPALRSIWLLKVGHNRRTCKSTAAGAGGGETANEVPNRERATESREEVLELYPMDSFNVGAIGDEGHGAAESGQGREDVDMDTLIGLYRSVPGYPLSDAEEEEASEEEERQEEPSGNWNVRFGTTQESQHPDFAPYGYDGPMNRIYEIAENMERVVVVRL